MFLIVLLVSCALWHINNAVRVNNNVYIYIYILALVSALYLQYLVVKSSEYRLARRRGESY